MFKDKKRICRLVCISLSPLNQGSTVWHARKFDQASMNQYGSAIEFVLVVVVPMANLLYTYSNQFFQNGNQDLLYIINHRQHSLIQEQKGITMISLSY